MTTLSLKHFIRETLGCGCPEKVFEKIEISRISHSKYAVPMTRVVVGDTLLIYLVEQDINDCEKIQLIAQQGRNDRNQNRYSRFRLVLPNSFISSRRREIDTVFSQAFSMDEKMHLHFVNRDLMPAIELDIKKVI